MTMAPGSDRWFIAEEKGRIFSFTNDPQAKTPDLFIDLVSAYEKEQIKQHPQASRVHVVYGLAFDPDFENNGYCYITYVLGEDKNRDLNKTPMLDGTRVSRFTVTQMNPPRCDPESEKLIFTWRAGGHNGGCIKFGPDGFLYIATGDATTPKPPDRFQFGQDVSDVHSAILRIDVRQTDGTDKPYSIPPDNPFVNLPGARPEIWAYGFRNPWKMSFDRATGDLWVGDVGWELWEMAYRIQRGGNYGWSVMEGPQIVRPEAKPGPTAILPPTIALPHSKAASITGGFVYRGKRLEQLQGTYVFGDWETRRMWAARHQAGKVTSMQELVDPTLRIVGFGEAHDGELYILDYDDGTIHELIPNQITNTENKFPRKLSDTGIFSSVSDHEPAPGVVPFSISAAQWSDHAVSQYLVALPEQSQIIVHPRNVRVAGTIMNQRLQFPANAVLTKTLSIQLNRDDPDSMRRIETQILHFTGKRWNGYSYRWNQQQTDAHLIEDSGEQIVLSIAHKAASKGLFQQTWRFASRAQCARCHNPWAQHTLAFNLLQLNHERQYGDSSLNQLEALQQIGLITAPLTDDDSRPPKPIDFSGLPQLPNPRDKSVSLDRRARSYLQINCAHCHQHGAGGTASFDIRIDKPLEKTGTLGVRPQQGAFAIHNGKIIAAAEPYRSVLYYRMAKLGPGRMPYIGSSVVDRDGLALIHDWIGQMSDQPDKDSTVKAQRKWLRQLSKLNPTQQNSAIAEHLASTTKALRLATLIDASDRKRKLRSRIVSQALTVRDQNIRDLFERFVPEDQRTRRLGDKVDPNRILTMKGDAKQGEQLFAGSTLQCKQCHNINTKTNGFGPDLTQIGKRSKPQQILESILEPSKFIDPKFVTMMVETTDGQVHVGLLVEKNDSQVVLRNAQKQLQIPAADVLRLSPQRLSLMPNLLVRDLTAQQLADLLAYLTSLK